MRILIGVTSTAPTERNPHVVPTMVVSDLSLPRLPGDQGRNGGKNVAVVRRAAAASGLLPAVPQPRGDPPRRAGALVPQRARGVGLHLADRHLAPRRMPVVRRGATDFPGLGRVSPDLHP